jgi:excisionase family DNA binding protein
MRALRDAYGCFREADLVRDRALVPTTLTMTAAARYLGVSRSTFYEHVAAELPLILIGSARRVRVRDLDRYLERKAAETAWRPQS